MVLLAHPVSAQQQADMTVAYSEQHPLVYEDAWDLWPYCFLDENGEPAGFNVDLVELLSKELDIPYVIRLKQTAEALEDIKSGRSDLMFRIEAPLHAGYGSFGKSVVQIFTHSIVHRKDAEPLVKRLQDLRNAPVLVRPTSYCYDLMKRKGWADNAVVFNDIREALPIANNDPTKQVLWNTVSLKWLVHQYHYDDLVVSPVDIPHGRYKFLSSNPLLLERLDSAYAVLSSSGKLQDLQNKWFYPDQHESGIPSWVWWVVVVLAVAAVGINVSIMVYRRVERRMTKEIRRSNKRLALVLSTSHVHIWVYSIYFKVVTIYGEDGNEVGEEPLDSFLRQRMSADEADRIRQALDNIAEGRDNDVSFEIVARTTADSPYRTYVTALAVLHRDRDDLPTEIIGTTCDITEERLRQQQVKDNMLRYQSVFNSTMVDSVTYDGEGRLVDMNEMAGRHFLGGSKGALERGLTLDDFLGPDTFPLDTLDTVSMTRLHITEDNKHVFDPRLYNVRKYYEMQLVALRDATGRLLNIFGTGRDVTEVVKSFHRLRENARFLEQASAEKQRYIRNIDYVLKNGGVRMVHYSPETHTLVVYSETDHVQYQLTQTRALMLTDDSAKQTAVSLLNSMDNRTNTSLKAAVKTLIPLPGGKRLQLYFSFIPTIGADGQVSDYFGMCRDISDIKATEEELALETAKAQEVETLKSSFLRNMSYEIRVPLNSVVGFAELFGMEHDPADEEYFISEIKENSARLLRLISDILLLSRLDAHMIEFKPAPIDFSAFFEPRCLTAWFHEKHDGVEQIVDNHYSRLVVDIDDQNVGILIDQIAANAARYTTQGQVRASYDYTGDALVLCFQDTGCGIPADMLEHIFYRFGITEGTDTGLGLSICHELVELMGGKINIQSEVGKGTTVWVSIPCKCLEIIRK